MLHVRINRVNDPWALFGALFLLLAGAPAAVAQAGFVAGMVVDTRSNEPVSGVQVVVAGGAQGAATDVRGRFRISGLSGDSVTLRATRLGYRPLTRRVRVGDANVRLELLASTVQLDATVVLGAPVGVQARSIGNVVEHVDAAEIVRTAPVTSVAQLLDGRAPGVVLQNSSGMIGAGPRIKIRGGASLSLSSEPLLYVDGARVDNSVGTGPGALVSRLNDIDPATIESIEIIKGPAASTLYGTEASNGVIQIRTKRGAGGGGAVISTTIRQGTNWFMNAEDRFPTYYYRDPASGVVTSGNLLTLERQRGTPVLRTGRAQEYALDVRGGGTNVDYYAAGAYADNTGIEPTNGERRANGRVNLGFTPRDSLTITLNQGLVINRTRLANGNDGSSVLTQALWGGLSLLNTPTRGFLSTPPEAVWAATERSLDINRYTGSITFDHRPTSWLAQRFTGGLDLTDQTGTVLTPLMGPDLSQFYSNFTASGSKTIDRRTTFYTTMDYSASATHSLGSAFNSVSSVGGQFYRKAIRIEALSGQTFPAAGVTTIAGAATRLGSDDIVENTTVGMFVQQQVAWKNRFFLTAALRGDDNSAFGANFNFVTYPKLSASWVVNEEPFFHVPSVSALKLRAAYGASGKQPDAFAAVRTFGPRTGPGGTAAVTPQSIGNPDLGPERGTELELGLDLGLLDDRYTAGATFYNNKTTDAILLRAAAPSNGFPGAQYVNAGEVASHGIELMLRGRAFERPRFALDLSGTYSTNVSEINNLGGLGFIARREISGYKPGYPVDAFFLKRVVSADLTSTGTATNILCDGGPDAAPVSCSSAPRVYGGRSTPARQAAFTSTITLFSRFRLSGLVDYQGGFKKFNKDYWNRCPWGIDGNCPERVFPEQFDPVRIAEIQIGDLGTSGSALEDGSFAKLRELSLGYTLPASLVAHAGARLGTLSIAGRNLHTWTRYTGFDPEALSSQAFDAERWGDQGAVPQLAQFLVTLNLTF
ncbi:MAG: SusC/RagA family TonB-linked outer membrane protein [Gemmatimonadota bacterium]|nr:SusC/RagA family TonB-linked outer membrane protein [Gemmatimonadota bacterium]